MELETHLILAVRTNRLNREDAMQAWKLCQEVGKMLTTMIKRMTKD